MRDGQESAREALGGACKMIRDLVPRPPNRKSGNAILSQFYTPLCGASASLAY